VKDAGESERIFTALGTAIANQGGNWDAMKTSVEGVLTSMSSTSKFSDEQLAASLRTLVTAGMPVEQALKTLSTAMDTAVGSGQPLDTVSTAIAKAFGGQDTALTRLVPGMGDLVKQLGPGATEGDKFAAAMDGLNQKFSGQAAADASTYAGTQERLKNAANELGEKIGSILTPALTTMSGALIPIVDALGTGITNVQNWITAVGKMPEVQGAIDTVNTAFSGFIGYLGDTWDSVKNDFGPALDELSKAFGLMGDALKPLWDAFSEIIKAMGGSGDDVNPLKILLEGVVLVIKGLAEVIKLAVPIVKGFADGFKAAADLIAPPLKTISDAVGGFIKLLTDAFQGFYDFLVGHSLWQDLWDAVVKVAGGVGTALATVVKAAFDLLIGEGGVIPLAMQAVSTILSTGFDLAFLAIQGIVQLGVNALIGILQPLVDKLGQGQQTWTDLSNAVTKNIADMKGKMDELLAKVNSTGQSMITSWKQTVDTMASDTKAAFDRIVSDIAAAVDAIIANLRWAQGQITAHSIWPDMLGSMVDQTKDALRSITGQFDQLLSMPGEFTPEIAANLRGSQSQAAGSSGPMSFSAEIPLTSTIMIDGEQIQMVIQRNTVRQMKLQGVG
jgi:phage-related protein